jgi:uncharacterized membrane protein
MKLLTNIIFTLTILLSPSLALAQNNLPIESIDPGVTQLETFAKAKVTAVLFDETRESGNIRIRSQELEVSVQSGPERGQKILISTTNDADAKQQWYSLNDLVVLSKVTVNGEVQYIIAESYRLPTLGILVTIFIALAVVFAGRKGFTSLLGLMFSILVLAKYVAPQILAGANPILIGLSAAIVIAVIALYLAHGINKNTSVALLSTLITLGIASLMASLSISASKLLGLGSEEAYYLQAGFSEIINLKGLLFAGIIIGTLGVLDDVTTSQVAAVDELQKANPNLSFKELFKRGSNIGREHIASLINTLVLAYAGASLPLFLLFVINNTQPLWVILNSEFVAEELVRTLVGSSALILAVPISTSLAAYLLKKDWQFPKVNTWSKKI